MFYYISGKVALLTQGKAVIDAGGVGYQLSISDYTLSRLRAEASDKALLYTYFHVREDAQELFGFHSIDEKKLFEHLISVSGVGPKVALSILSTLSPEKLVLAIVSDDAKAISCAQGIGLRTAQKIILEIKDKLKKEGLGDVSEPLTEELSQTPSSAVNEALEALSALGYSRSQAMSALKIDGRDRMSVEELIRHGLKNLTK